MDLDSVAYCAIHPTIGIARVGDSPDGWFPGPEAPGLPPRPEGGFKDAEGRVKRQAARFRVYGYDAAGAVVGELTAAEADVTWTVELVNAKGAWYRFAGRHATWERPDNLRNAHVPAERRAELVIRPGARTIRGAERAGVRFDGGTFLGVAVPLGELRTDDAGRLLVLGGHGRSGSVLPDEPLTSFANNDNWYDDTSDGPVTATVRLGERSVPVTGAWVIVGPPDFSPETASAVTLYDTAVDVAQRAGWLPPPDRVSFTRDIHPLLARLGDHRWVSAAGQRGHGAGEPGDLLQPAVLGRLCSASAEDADARAAVLARVRTPGAADPTQANYAYMPPLGGDAGDPQEGDPRRWHSLTAAQYEQLRRWAAGDFAADWPGAAPEPVPFARIPLAEQPHALVRAVLEAASGGPWYPGIEISFPATEPGTWQEPFRLHAATAPGDVTRYLAVPWQADFYECHTHWWPAQRPDDVLPETAYLALLGLGDDGSGEPPLPAYRLPWARGLGEAPVPQPVLTARPGESAEQRQRRVRETWQRLRAHAGKNEMVTRWSRLGFVAARRDPWGRRLLVETERAHDVGMSDREWFYVLQHPDQFPRQAEAARDYAQRVLDLSEARHREPGCDELYRPFPYTREALDARLECIYLELIRIAEQADPAANQVFRSREDVVERLVQMAPFNLMDGAWLRNATPPGPIDRVHGTLFQIWQDEIGGGDPALNHANIYDSLLRGLGVYLPPVDSYEFAFLPDLLDQAYTVPAFELAISQHSEHFLPEILGMTLHLEWEILGVKPGAELLEHHGVDAGFYRMHIGIDNAATGHGALAREAVHRYLDEVYSRGGEAARQHHWHRIWNGYTAFATHGSLYEAVAEKLRARPRPAVRLAAMITAKAHYAALNHGSRMLGGNYLNDLVAGPPEQLLAELVAAGTILPGDPDASPFFRLTGPTGPMYKVFTPAELELWREWCRSLAAAETPDGLSPLEAMVRLVDMQRHRQANAAAHATTPLTGPDPAGTGASVTQPVAWWFRQPTAYLLNALAEPANGLVVPGDPQASRLLHTLLAPNNTMGRAFQDPVAGTGTTGAEIVRRWIEEGCPVPVPVPAAQLTTMYSAQATGGPGSGVRVPGMGSVH